MAKQVTFNLVSNSSPLVIHIQTYVNESISSREVHINKALSVKKSSQIPNSIVLELGEHSKVYNVAEIGTIFGNTHDGTVLSAIEKFYYPWD